MTPVVIETIPRAFPAVTVDLADEDEAETLRAASGVLNALLAGAALWTILLVPFVLYLFW